MEVIMVVAVLAILAGILFPLLRHCRKQPLRSKCLSNMHQLGKAFFAYIEDWENRWPCPGGLVGDRSYWAQSGGGGLVPYVQCNGGLKSIWCCPELTEWHGIYPPRSYGMNSYMRDPVDWEWIDPCGHPLGITITKGIHDNQIPVPSRTILLYEGIPETRPPWGQNEKSREEKLNHIDRCGNWTQVRGWFPDSLPKRYSIDSTKPWHGRFNNYVYCDGHAVTTVPHKHPSDPTRDCTNEWYVQKFRKYPKGKAPY